MRGAAVLLPVFTHAVGERVNIPAIGVVVADEVQVGECPPVAPGRADLIVHRSGGGAAGLRKQRQYDDAARAGGTEPAAARPGT